MKLKDLIQEKMNISEYQSDGLKVVIGDKNLITLSFSILGEIFQITDNSVPDMRRISDVNPAKRIHTAIMKNTNFRNHIISTIKVDLKGKINNYIK